MKRRTKSICTHLLLHCVWSYKTVQTHTNTCCTHTHTTASVQLSLTRFSCSNPKVVLEVYNCKLSWLGYICVVITNLSVVSKQTDAWKMTTCSAIHQANITHHSHFRLMNYSIWERVCENNTERESLSRSGASFIIMWLQFQLWGTKWHVTDHLNLYRKGAKLNLCHIGQWQVNWEN